MDAAATRSSQDTIAQFDKYVIPNYGRYPISLVRGKGSHVWDAEGNRYLDLFPGWGCNILGHCPATVIEAVQKQVANLIHIPNTWYIEAQGDFAEAIGAVLQDGDTTRTVLGATNGPPLVIDGPYSDEAVRVAIDAQPDMDAYDQQVHFVAGKRAAMIAGVRMA